MQKKFLPIITFAKVDIKRLFRDKVAIFFTFVFPLIFLFVFGGLFANNTEMNFDIAIINKSQSQFSREFVDNAKKDKIFKVDAKAESLEQAKEKMSRGELDAAIVLPENFGEVTNGQYPTGTAEVVYNKNSEQAGQSIASILEAVFKDINAKFVPVDMPFNVATKPTGTEGLTQFDYVVSGLIGFSIMSLGIFGPTNVFPKLKQRGVLRRYRTTTLKVWQYFLGNVISNVFVGILSITTMLTVAVTVFHLNMKGSYLVLLLLVILSAATLFGIGLAVGGWAKNENQAAPLANLVTFPMMFLSGSFFPRFLMPEWIQHISTYLPLTPVIDAARLIITENRSLVDLAPQFGLIAAWCVVIYLIALKVFRWE